MAFDHYVAQNKAWVFLDQLVMEGSVDGVDVNKLLLLVTRKFPVSERAVVKRLERLCLAWGLEIVEGVLKKQGGALNASSTS